jgi:hypothetical protein
MNYNFKPGIDFLNTLFDGIGKQSVLSWQLIMLIFCLYWIDTLIPNPNHAFVFSVVFLTLGFLWDWSKRFIRSMKV